MFCLYYKIEAPYKLEGRLQEWMYSEFYAWLSLSTIFPEVACDVCVGALSAAMLEGLWPICLSGDVFEWR